MNEAKASDDDAGPGPAPNRSLTDRPGRLGPPFDGSRCRVDNARVWGRRERLQRRLGPSLVSLSPGDPGWLPGVGGPTSAGLSTPSATRRPTSQTETLSYARGLMVRF